MWPFASDSVGAEAAQIGSILGEADVLSSGFELFGDFDVEDA